MSLLQALGEPQDVFKYFLQISNIPRPSGKAEDMQKYLFDFATTRGLVATKDSIGNVCLRRCAPNGSSNTNRPGIVMQAHMDMVTSKVDSSNHDFLKDPLQLRIDGDYLYATGTTLGADNGVGLCAALALLADKTLEVECDLEAVITVDEETTMGGAEQIARAPFLQGSIMINVDSEESNSICVGCAGGAEQQIVLPTKKISYSTDRFSSSSNSSSPDMAIVQLRVSGCIGGHTGIDIHKGHANAIQVLARLLDATRQFSYGIVEMKGGNAPNAIPRDCQAVLVLSTERLDEWKHEIESAMESIKKEFIGIERDENGMKCDIVDIQPTTSIIEAASVASSHVMVDLLLTVPHGLIRNVPGLRDAVETSISLSVISYHKDVQTHDDLKALETPFIVHVFTRSSSEQQVLAMERRLLAIARAFHAQCTPKFNSFPGWMPNMKSAALAKTIEAHKTLFGSEPHIYSVHAGLECGFLQQAYPNMVCVSIGPTIENAHSPDERLMISSVLPFYQWLRQTVQNCSTLTIQ